MSKSSCFAVVLAAICLSVILLSLGADAHPIVDENSPWSAATLEVRIIPSNHQQNGQVKESCGKANEEAVNMVNIIESIQQQHAQEIKEIKHEIEYVKSLLVSGNDKTNETYRLEDVVKEVKDLKKLIAPTSIALDALEPSKQTLVSALVSNCDPLLIQQNVDGSNFFHRSWAEFKVGFGDPSGNYWLGNKLLNQLTANNRYKLKFDLQSLNNRNWYYAAYSTFIVETEAYNYRLVTAGYSGNAEDAFHWHDGMMFSTHDRDNDPHTSKNCAACWGGGFWYKFKDCLKCGVNSASEGFIWEDLPGGDALQSSRMWLQCK